MVNILSEAQIKELNYEEKERYFVDLQNFVVVNLTTELRKEYGNNQRKIALGEWERKIKFLLTYLNYALMSSKLKKKIVWVETNFPEKSSEILDRLNKKLDKDKSMFLNNQIAKLKKDIPQKLSNEKDKILRELRELLGRDDTADFLKSIIENKLKEQVSLLKRKVNRIKAMQNKKTKQISSRT